MAEHHPYMPVHFNEVMQRLVGVAQKWTAVNKESSDAAKQESDRRSADAGPPGSASES